MERKHFLVTGRVQGVGFRPFVFREATRNNLTGCVGNAPEGVRIAVQGSQKALADFEYALRHHTPPLAHIVDIHTCSAPATPDEAEFVILPSPSAGTGHAVLVSPDVAVCDDCLRELFDPLNSRYLYPFINCTNCGPRYTLTRSIPYDRATTSMACFPLCTACAEEYANPHNRRFHAQPNACPVCGPHVWFVADNQTAAAQPITPQAARSDPAAPLRNLATALLNGAIAAIKGLGGFHLACDARNTEAVVRLRKRKHRPHKALAVMVASVDDIRCFAHVSEAEARLLESPERPIVTVSTRHCGAGTQRLSAQLAPDVDTLGCMLPYTPLHHVLLHIIKEQSGQPAALVMTSGNAGGDPICLGNREAVEVLGGMADVFLLHNRDILVRTDDSVMRVLPSGEAQFFRRARGFTPVPLPLPTGRVAGAQHAILAVGADLKNTLCLTRGNDAFVSQHIGDLANPATEVFFEEARLHLARLLKVAPHAVLCDAHPGYMSTRLAEAFAAEYAVPLYRVQHHKAHMFAVLGEVAHPLDRPVIGLSLDGTGYGDDGEIWGGEVFVATRGSECPDVKRVGRFGRFPLPGGEAAIREPWRIACAMQVLHNLPLPPSGKPPWLEAVGELKHRAVGELVQAEAASGRARLTSSCGRLFDAVSALLGLCSHITYEGQAAIRLERWQDTTESLVLPWAVQMVGGLWELDSALLLHGIAEGMAQGISAAALARRFHLALAAACADMAMRAATAYGAREVVLAGGVFHNRTMVELISHALEAQNIRPLVGKSLPPGDGSIAYGQAVWLRYGCAEGRRL